MQRFIGILVAFILTLGGYLAREEAARLWTSYRDYTSPFIAEPTRTTGNEVTTPLSNRIVVVIIRGLRLGESRQMSTLNAMRERGADVTLEWSAPTFRIPVLLTLMSGADVNSHGSATNDAIRNPNLDTIFKRASAANREAVVVGGAIWNDLFGEAIKRFDSAEAETIPQRDDATTNTVLQILRDPQSKDQFVVAELSSLEEAARFGADAYAASASTMDARIRSIFDAIDLSQQTLLVLSDRGLTPFGEDGGDEPEVAHTPLVLAGAGVRPKAQAIAKPTAFAPTISKLLGAATPTQSQSSPIFDAIESGVFLPSARQLTIFYENWSEQVQQPRFAAELLREHETRIANGDRSAFDVWFASLNQAVANKTFTKLSSERLARLPLVVGVSLFIIVCAVAMLGNRFWIPLVSAVVYFVAWFILFFFIRGYAVSFSMFRDSNPNDVLRAISFDASALILFVGVVSSFLSRVCDDWLEAITATLSSIGLIALVHAAQYLWFYWQWGDLFSWILPNASSMVNVLIALTQLNALNVNISTALPDMPVAIVVALLASLIYFLPGKRRNRSY
jgi:hypothetical protein